MGNIKDIEIWSSIYFDKTNNIWKGSIRSKTIDISTVATKFNGGGHKNASGFKLNNKEDFALVLKELSNLVS
jgi:nanoRNase/pAp phosphatase (c-di-AMP/oligoRNAs hydrolase)